MTDFRCIYYGHVKAESERSLEHIWPDALGGDYAPDFFKTRDVCGKCNSLSGQFVDGEFQRSFFAGAEARQGALAFLDTTKPAALPLIYMGNYPAPNAAEVCESWIGPRGERIFFFHARDREDFAGFAGGDPIRRGTKDGGRVYLGFTRPLGQMPLSWKRHWRRSRSNPARIDPTSGRCCSSRSGIPAC